MTGGKRWLLENNIFSDNGYYYGFAVNIIDWMIENKYIEQSTEHGKYNVVLTKKEFIEKYGLK